MSEHADLTTASYPELLAALDDRPTEVLAVVAARMRSISGRCQRALDRAGQSYPTEDALRPRMAGSPRVLSTHLAGWPPAVSWSVAQLLDRTARDIAKKMPADWATMWGAEIGIAREWLTAMAVLQPAGPALG